MTIYADVICGQHILLIKANFVNCKNSSAPLRYGGGGGVGTDVTLCDRGGGGSKSAKNSVT